MRTYKELQDAVLLWMADSDDTGLMRDLVKQALTQQHAQLLLEERFDFMLWPKTETLSIVANQTAYALHPRFQQPYFFFNPDTDVYLEEVPARSLMESSEDWNDGTFTDASRFMLTNISKWKQQPSTASVITITTTGGTESTSNTIILRGTDANGAILTETLSSGSAWSTLTSSNSFAVLEDLTKVGVTWARTITVTDAAANTLLSLGSTEYGRQYRMFETLGTPSAAKSILYRFYRAPRALVYDNDIPDVPEAFDEILVLRVCRDMQGYSRATSEEMDRWRTTCTILETQMKMTYQQARTMGGRPTYVRYIPRA
jgi:hypothetical protein